MGLDVQQCKVCGEAVTGFASTIEFVFREDTIEKVGETVKLPCGCSMDFVTFNLDFTTGIIDIVSEFTEETLITYYDEDIIMDEEDEEF